MKITPEYSTLRPFLPRKKNNLSQQINSEKYTISFVIRFS